MSYKKRTLNIILTLIVLSMTACVKEKVAPPEELGFISLGEAKDYLLFKPGSWWVYKNSVTNEYDSMLLSHCKLDTLDVASEKRHFIYENLRFQIESSRDGASYYNYSYGLDPDALNFIIVWNWYSQRWGGYSPGNTSSYPGAGCHFYYPFTSKLGDRERDQQYETCFLARKSSMTVDRKSYADVVSFKVPHDESYPYPNKDLGDGGISNYYWAKNTGLVKIEHQYWEYVNGNYNERWMNWDLIESHIIQ